MKTKKSMAMIMAALCLWGAGAHAQLITNYIPKTFNNSPEHVNSQLYDNGVNIGLGTTVPTEKFDVWGGNIRCSGKFISTVAIGVPPMQVTSTNLVNNLNCDMLDGRHYSDFSLTGHTHTDMVTGGGEDGRVAFWTDPDMISGNSHLFWVDNLEHLGIGTSTPEGHLHIFSNTGSAEILLQEAHPGLHGSLQNTQWRVENQQGRMVFSWYDNSNPVDIVKLSGGSATGSLEVNGNLKTSRLFISQGATPDYILSCTSNGMGVWKDPQLITGWTISGNNVLKNNGMVFIGQSNMGGKLNISTTTTPALMISSQPGAGNYAYGLWMQTNSNNIKAFAIEKDGVEQIVIWGNGYMQVANNIKANEVEVKIDVWQDAVFDPSYPLMSLHDLEAYINSYKHLPGIPAEAEVLENGIRVGEMQSLLLKKIEELTLYVIELEKRVTGNE